MLLQYGKVKLIKVFYNSVYSDKILGLIHI